MNSTSLSSPFGFNEVLLQERTAIGARISRLESLGGTETPSRWIRCHIEQFKVAASAIVGMQLIECTVGLVEAQGAIFENCYFRQVKFDHSFLSHCQFLHCTFDDVSFSNLPSDPSIQSVRFSHCTFFDTKGHLGSLNKDKSYQFEQCVLLGEGSFEAGTPNTVLPAIQFSPSNSAANAVAPAPKVPRPMPKEKEIEPPQTAKPTTSDNSKGLGRFGQLEVS